MQKTFLGKSIQIMLFVLLLGGILYIGKPLFMPLAIACMLALVFVPCANWLERKGKTKVYGHPDLEIPEFVEVRKISYY